MKKLIEIPDEYLQDLKILAIKENKDLKNFIQDTLISLVSVGKKIKKKKLLLTTAESKTVRH